MTRYLLPFICAVLGISANAFAADDLSASQTPVADMAKNAGVTVPPKPWHMADLWWYFNSPTEHFESLAMEFTIDRDIPSDYNLYVSPVGIGQINGMQFYGGLQTNINGWKSREDHTRVFPGKGAIFSRWSADKKIKIGLDDARLSADGICESAGYEGEFCSVRRPFAWTKGTYTYSIIKGDTETIAGQPVTWFHCLVRSHETGVETWIGSLRFEGSDFTYWNQSAAFLEIYSTERNTMSNIPRVKVTFRYPRINGIAPPLNKASVNYNTTGEQASPACAKAHVEGSDIVVDVGPLFPRAKEDGWQTLEVVAPSEKR